MNGAMGLVMMANGRTIILKEKASIAGLTTDFIKAHGKIILCMEMEFMNGQMAKSIKENLKKIKSMEKVR